MVFKVGITGGIGSGKTVICNIFRCLGIPVFEADLETKKLLDEDKSVKEGLIRLFGQGIYMPNNVIDRKKLASIIFNDEVALQKVNNLTHPVVREKFESWCMLQHSPYIIHEAAILMESGFSKLMDHTILVVSNTEDRIQRVMKRDNVNREQVLERMSKQMDDTKKIKLADTVIYNNQEILIPQVLNIHQNLISILNKKN